jgi:hypothetical protein
MADFFRLRRAESPLEQLIDRLLAKFHMFR